MSHRSYSDLRESASITMYLYVNICFCTEQLLDFTDASNSASVLPPADVKKPDHQSENHV